MKKQGEKIEVRFFETAEFHVTPREILLEGGDCAAAVE
jgi:hypothetical protein